MTRPTARLALFALATTPFLIALARQTPSQQPPTCEQVFKNIQVFKGVPASDLIPPAVLSRVEPEWSEFAAKVRLQGTVRMDVTVTAQGTAGAVWLTRSLGLGLDEQAYFAIREWRFRPAESGGRAVPGALAVDVNFHS